jgi:hypothetical protein
MDFVNKAGSLLGKVDPISGLFNKVVGIGEKKGSAAPAPSIAKPAVMPTTDDEAVKAARRRQAAELASRSGRASTILSQDDKVGG